MQDSATFDMLYNQALLDIALSLKQNGFICRSAWYASDHGDSSIVLEVKVTVRIRATRLLFDTLMFALSRNVTPKTVLAGANQGAACRALGLSLSEFRALMQGGMPCVMEQKREQLAQRFVQHGVSLHTARALVTYVIQRRDEVIQYLEYADEVGCDTHLSLIPPGH